MVPVAAHPEPHPGCPGPAATPHGTPPRAPQRATWTQISKSASGAYTWPTGAAQSFSGAYVTRAGLARAPAVEDRWSEAREGACQGQEGQMRGRAGAGTASGGAVFGPLAWPRTFPRGVEAAQRVPATEESNFAASQPPGGEVPTVGRSERGFQGGFSTAAAVRRGRWSRGGQRRATRTGAREPLRVRSGC